MLKIFKVLFFILIFNYITNYSHSKVDEKQILFNSAFCAQHSLEKQKIELKFLQDVRQLIDFYKNENNFSQLTLLLKNVTFCYRSLDETNKIIFQNKYFEDVEFLIKKKETINFKDKFEQITYYNLLSLYLFDQISSKNYEKNLHFLIGLIEELQINYPEGLDEYVFFLSFFNTENVTYEQFLKLDKILSKAQNQLSSKTNQIAYFLLTKQQANLYNIYNIKECDNLFNKIKNNFYPEGYLNFIQTSRIITSCYLSTDDNGGYYYPKEKIIDLELFLENKIKFFINNLNNFKGDLNSTYHLSLNSLKLELEKEYLKTLLNLYNYSNIFDDQNLIKENYLEKYYKKNNEFFFRNKKAIYLYNNRPYIKALIDKGDIEKADEEINKSLDIINLSNKDFLDDVLIEIDKNFENSKYDENFATAKHTKESLKYDFLTYKSKILKIKSNYKDNVAILEKKIEFHLKNIYSQESYEWVHDLPESFSEIIESLVFLEDYKKAEIYYQKGNQHCEKLKTNTFLHYSNENKKFGYVQCRMFYGKSFKLVIKTKDKKEIKNFYETKIKPVLDYYDEFDQKDMSLTKNQKNKRIVERETLKVDYFASQKMIATPELCSSSTKLFNAVQESMEIFDNRRIFGALAFAMVCDPKLLEKSYRINLLEKLITATLNDYIEDSKYIKNISEFYSKSQDTDPIPSNIFLLLARLYEDTKDTNDKIKIKDYINNLFKVMQLQDAEYLINSNKNINNKYQINDANIVNLLKDKKQLANQFAIINSRLFETKTDQEIKNLIEQKNLVKRKIDNITLILKDKKYLVSKINDVETPSISDIQKKLKDDEALVYIDTKVSGHVGSYVILKNDFNFFSDYSNEGIYEAVSFLRKDIIDQKDSFLVWSGIVYKKLFSKHSNYLKEKKITKIFIVVDKKLSDLPFEALITNAPEITLLVNTEEYIKEIKKNAVKYLINDFSISYFPSVLTFYENYNLNEKINSETSFLGIGSPKFKNEVVKKDIAKDITQYINLNNRGYLENTKIISERYNELPGTKKELNSLKLLFKKNKVLLDQEATEKNLKNENLNQYGVIAFATHAEVSGVLEGFNEPFLVLTPPKKSSDNDDGLLTASEISSLNLNARLIILSACNTAAKGNKYADGFSGLVNSFLIAGADSVLATHWPVEDNATYTMISETLKESLKNNVNISESLRDIKLRFINGEFGEEYRKPLFWAPYIMIGK